MKISYVRYLKFPQQNPIKELVQDRCMRLSCAKCKMSVSKSPQYDHLCKISVCGCLVQDLCIRIL